MNSSYMVWGYKPLMDHMETLSLHSDISTNDKKASPAETCLYPCNVSYNH